MPGPGSFWIGDEERQEILDVLNSGHLYRYGNLNDPKFRRKVLTLEKEFSEYIGTNHTLATSSGTSALFISLLALGVGPGDEIIVPAYTFVASYSAPIFLGAVPVICEIDESLNIDPIDIERRITPRTKVIVPVHMLGNPCEMDTIMAIASKHGLPVLEDACQAAGAVYKGNKVGSMGAMGAFSLNVFKTITAGDGGMISTKDKNLFEYAFGVHDQGYSPTRGGLEAGGDAVLGMSFRMNELTGAVALAQLRKVDRITATLREKKAKLKESIAGIEGLKFRTLNDPDGECGTLLTVIFDEPRRAAQIAKTLGTKTVDDTGWHVYDKMEHVNRHLKQIGRPYGKGAYPRTDDILSRSINISVGVVDAGLGSAFGININSSDEEIETVASQFRHACS
jgi:dTDP-4-amino-4,6-dideoxygalactose transaminase